MLWKRAYVLTVAKVLIEEFFSVMLAILILMALIASLAALFASLLVSYEPFNSIHGKVSSILIHALNKSFHHRLFATRFERE